MEGVTPKISIAGWRPNPAWETATHDIDWHVGRLAVDHKTARMVASQLNGYYAQCLPAPAELSFVITVKLPPGLSRKRRRKLTRQAVRKFLN